MAATLTPRTLRCEYLVNPLGIDTPRPRLSWTLDAEGRAKSQSAYRILVSRSSEGLSDGRADLWDCGRVESDRTSHVEYGGGELKAGERAWWTVQVWDQDGQPAASGETAWWERGLEHDDWHGRWIGLDAWNGLHMPATLPPGVESDPDAPLAGLIPSPYLRTTVSIEGKVRRARVHVTAKGL